MITYILALLLMLPTPALPLAPPLALKTLLSSNTCHLMPCVYDGLSASLVARSHHHFNVTFQTGFGVASVAGYPDAGILQRAENNNAAFTVAEALANTALSHNRSPIPCIADGDTGHGSAMNIRRTIHQYGRAQMAGVMIEDQVSPKRCGHVDGKEVVAFEEAVRRIKIACDARDEYELLYNTPGPLILARTDARGVADGTLEDAIRRCQAFIDAGADLTFLEAPQTVAEMEEYCERVPGPKVSKLLRARGYLTVQDDNKICSLCQKGANSEPMVKHEDEPTPTPQSPSQASH